MEFTAEFLRDLGLLRREYHSKPELSNNEMVTALSVATQLMALSADKVTCGIGGSGIIAEFDSGVPGPSVLFRAELDALPIQEINDFSHKSCVPGVSHKCGHDGHLATVMGVAQLVSHNKPKRGKVYVLFQPAEETGSGAQAMLTDPAFIISPDYVFAYHNIPGHPLGQVIFRHGAVTASVRSLVIKLTGKTSHAAEPECGISPAMAISRLITIFHNLSNNDLEREDFRVITVVHVNMGEVAYGVTPGYGEIHLTIRTWTETEMVCLVREIEQDVTQIAKMQKLAYELEWVEIFVSNINDPDAVHMLEEAAVRGKCEFQHAQHPMKWGEDFGHFTAKFKGAFFCVGAGEAHAALHNPDYDFPDEILGVALKVFIGVLQSPALNMY